MQILFRERWCLAMRYVSLKHLWCLSVSFNRWSLLRVSQVDQHQYKLIIFWLWLEHSLLFIPLLNLRPKSLVKFDCSLFGGPFMKKNVFHIVCSILYQHEIIDLQRIHKKEFKNKDQKAQDREIRKQYKNPIDKIIQYMKNYALSN